MNNDFWVGFDKAVITPSKEMVMSGYVVRKRKSIGKIDDLYMRTLYLKDARGKEVLTILLEVIRIDDELYRQISERIHEEFGISKNNIHVVATHTHSGPEVSINYWSTTPLKEDDIKEIEEYREFLIEKSVETTRNAFNNSVRAKIYVGKTLIRNVATNRIDPRGPMDYEAVYMLFRNAYGKNIALIINYACHPTVLGAENLKFSGDLVGRIMQRLEEELGIPVYFFNGAAGNVSTRFTRKDRSVHCLEELVGRFIRETMNSLRSGILEPISKSTIYSGVRRVSVGIKSIDTDIEDLAEIKHDILEKLETLKRRKASSGDIRKLESALEGISLLINKLSGIKNMHAPRIEFDIKYTIIGDKVLAVYFPGEAFIEYQLHLKQKSIYPYVMFIGYADGYIGYLPYGENSYHNSEYIYEEIVSLINPGDREKILRILEEIATQKISS